MSNETQTITLDYRWEKVFYAVEQATLNIRGIKISSSNKITKTISLKASVSIRSYGENITISLTPIDDEKTSMTISSVTKAGGYVADLGKNRKNIDSILDEMTKYLIQETTHSSDKPSDKKELKQEHKAEKKELKRDYKTEKKELKQELKADKKELKSERKAEKRNR
jgi:hypothetical protein